MSEERPKAEIGQSRRPHEDERLVLGQGSFVADQRLPGLLHVTFVRSIYAHARVSRLDIYDAASAPGVVAILTANDLPP